MVIYLTIMIYYVLDNVLLGNGRLALFLKKGGDAIEHLRGIDGHVRFWHILGCSFDTRNENDQ